MPSLFLEPWMPLAFGILVALAAALTRALVVKKPLSVSPFQLFLDAGVGYVLIVLITQHYFWHVEYADLLGKSFSLGLGLDSVSIAFLYACYHMTAEIIRKVRE